MILKNSFNILKKRLCRNNEDDFLITAKRIDRSLVSESNE